MKTDQQLVDDLGGHDIAASSAAWTELVRRYTPALNSAAAWSGLPRHLVDDFVIDSILTSIDSPARKNQGSLSLVIRWVARTCARQLISQHRPITVPWRTAARVTAMRDGKYLPGTGQAKHTMRQAANALDTVELSAAEMVAGRSWSCDTASDRELCDIAFAAMSPQSEAVCRATYGFDGNQPLNDLQIAEDLRISPARVSALRASGLRDARAALIA